MRVHHLSAGTLCPYGRRFVQAEGGVIEPSNLVCHCLLIESDRGLILVDTGIGTHDVAAPSRLSRRMRMLLRPRLSLESTALAQVQSLGFAPDDVRHIVLTHLDFDHAGGLADFPRARVHVLEQEHATAMMSHRIGPQRSGAHVSQGRARYRPKQWQHQPRWELYEAGGGEPWFGFQAVRDLVGLPPEILLVPLVGHTPGHTGVAVEAPEGWLLHAGDAYFFHAEVNARRPWCPPGLVAYQTLMETDRSLRLENQRRLRGLMRAHGDEVSVFCAHDPRELRELQARMRPVTTRPHLVGDEANGESGKPRPRPSL